MAANHAFSEEEMDVNQHLGYPKAYAYLCRDRSTTPYSLGPPFTFTPYALKPDEVLEAEDLELMFPIIDPKAKPTAKPKVFVSLLWKQLNHLGNAGFDPAVIRVDHYGNVLYFHADSASPLAWDIDHWFPCSRGGLTVPSNLRILQWQACKRKHNQLEFLIPWWDFQLGVSVNQFLSIFASSNSDFRQRAFSFLFSEGENEEINPSQSVNGHSFPHHFVESREKIGLAPAAIVVSRRESSSREASAILKSLDHNKQLWPHQAAIASRKVKPLKENENPDQVLNTYQAIAMARDSLKQKEEAKKLQAELHELDNEVIQMKRKNEEEKLAIQDLELALIKRRRRAEKCRRLAEAQSSYRTMLEKMIRDAMHQSVVYKEQVRLNQTAANALMARLEAQKAICDASEKELHRIHKQKDEIEKQIQPDWEKARKRSRVNDDFLINDDEEDHKPVLYLPGVKPRTPLHKELRVLLQEEQRAALSCFSPVNELKDEEDRDDEEHGMNAVKEIEEAPEMGEINGRCREGFFSVVRDQEREEDGETRKLRGKENVEKWLQMLLENTPDEPASSEGKDQTEPTSTHEIINDLNLKYPHEAEKWREDVLEKECEVKKDGTVEIESPKPVVLEEWKVKKDWTVETESPKPVVIEAGSGRKVDRKERREKGGKEKVLARSESARTFRRIPSSPSIILGMKKGVDCIRKKSMVFSDDEGDENYGSRRNILSSSFKSIKKAVKI